MESSWNPVSVLRQKSEFSIVLISELTPLPIASQKLPVIVLSAITNVCVPAPSMNTPSTLSIPGVVLVNVLRKM